MNETVVDKTISFVTVTDDDGVAMCYEIHINGTDGKDSVIVTGDSKDDCIEQLESYLTKMF